VNDWTISWFNEAGEDASGDALSIGHGGGMKILKLWVDREGRMLLISSVTGEDRWDIVDCTDAIDWHRLNEVRVNYCAIHLQ
jgi:hypothetical protein